MRCESVSNHLTSELHLFRFKPLRRVFEFCPFQCFSTATPQCFASTATARDVDPYSIGDTNPPPPICEYLAACTRAVEWTVSEADGTLACWKRQQNWTLL